MRLKKIISILILTLFTALDSAAEGPLFYGQSYGFVVSDPAAMLIAMDEYRASETGQKTPNTVVLSQNIVNGDYASTHQVNVFYPSTAAMDQSLTLNMASTDWATFLGKLRNASESEWENMYAIMRAKVQKDPATMQNPISLIYTMTVKNPADFMPAFDKLWNSEEMGKFQGNIYLGRNLASGNVKGTHFVSFVAENNSALIDGITAMQTSDAMKSYVNAVSESRTLEATNVSIELKRWSR
tara:strand:- start:175 stop:897 length:723 start_codon:yes stop_codon:yes gene_type:complete